MGQVDTQKRDADKKQAILTGGPIDTSRTQFEKQRVMAQEHRNNVQKIIQLDAGMKRHKEEIAELKEQVKALTGLVTLLSKSLPKVDADKKDKKESAPKNKTTEAPAQ